MSNNTNNTATIKCPTCYFYHESYRENYGRCWRYPKAVDVHDNYHCGEYKPKDNN